MELNPFEEENEEENTITEQREELMIPPNCEGNPTLRIAHFLKPLLNPKIQPLPKTPLHNSLSSNPKIIELEKGVTFKGRLKPQWSWKSWVEELQKTHKSIWKKVGIFDAIKGSTYKIKRDNKLIMCLAEKWCSETNTFVFSWGEITVTLEDIMILGGFSVMGKSVLLNPCFKSNKFAKIKDELLKSCLIIKKKCCNNVSHIGWLDYYMGKGGELEHVAFLILWLSRYVLSTCPYIVCGKNNVMNIAISLAMGTKVALAPAVLASIYRDLTLLKEKKDSSDQLYLWAPFHLVQLWAWERFPTSSPKPVCLAHGEPRMARWQHVKRVISENLRLEIESAGDSFVWRPYVVCLKNWDIPKFYCDYEGMWVVINSDIEEEMLSFVSCLRACELVGLDCVMQYLPHRVGMQFGMDQDIPAFVPRFNGEYTISWSSYAKSMEGLKVYMPPRLFEGDVTMQYSRWWMPNLGVDADDDELLITYSRRSRSWRKRKSLCLQLKGCVGGSHTKTLITCSPFEGMTSERPLNVVDKTASCTPLNAKEGVVADKEMGRMVEYVSPNTSLNEQMEHWVAGNEKGKMVVETPLNSVEDIGVAEHFKGTHAHEDVELSTMALVKAVNQNEPGLETKKLCSVLAEDCNALGKDAMETVEVKHTHENSSVDVEEQDWVEYILESSRPLESRISRLEKILSMHKLVKFGRVDV